MHADTSLNQAPSADALSQNALEVLHRRYLIRNDAGEVIESPGELFRRVARAVAVAEKTYVSVEEAGRYTERFAELMARRLFLPNSPTLMNAGRRLGQLAACFVLPVPDSMEGIFETLKHAALIHQSGGGTGFSFSRLRPHGARVRSSGGTASGPVSFLRVFNSATDAIKQGGTRRGANMGILRVDHPDILQFIDLKRKPSELTNFNLSVGVTDAFMAAVADGKTYTLLNPEDGSAYSELDAHEVFDRLVDAAWMTGDPGVVFLDRVNAGNPTPDQGAIEATNPCGEQPLLPYEACNLGSINVCRFVRDGAIDWARLEESVHLAIRFLDDVIDVNCYPLPQVEAVVRRNRRIGLGIMGFADLLIELGIPYDSDEAVATGARLMEALNRQAIGASEALAAERGAFPSFATSIHAGGTPRRNATVTTVAPTGTIAMIADCSSGIEPLFAVSFVKRVMDGTELTYIHPAFVRMAREAGIESAELFRTVARTGGVRDIPAVPERIRRLLPTSHDLTPLWHVRMQAAFQSHTENAVSKTVNFARGATHDDVRQVYLLSHELGLKGVTVYRDGSREGQVLTRGDQVAAVAAAAAGGDRQQTALEMGVREPRMPVIVGDLPGSGGGEAAGGPAVPAAPLVGGAGVGMAEQPELDLKPLVQSRDICPECGGVLVHCEGCRSCPACGLSMC